MSEEAEHEVDEAARDMGDDIADMQHHLDELGEEIADARAEEHEMEERTGLREAAGDWREADEGEALQGGTGDDPEGA